MVTMEFFYTTVSVPKMKHSKMFYCEWEDFRKILDRLGGAELTMVQI